MRAIPKCPAGLPRTENDRIIVSCGIGDHYAPGDASTQQHCERHCPEAWQLFFNEYPDGCPAHADQQYAFKIFSIRSAVAEGFRYILWMDSSFQPVGPMDRLWNEIEANGWYVPPQWFEPLSRWCSDAALEIFGITRATAATIPLVYSGIVGLDMQNPIGIAIWNEWERLYELGAFNGPHANDPGRPREPWGQKWRGHVSHDQDVQGHRHDEAALSFVLYKLGLTPPRKGFLTYETPDGFIGHHIPCQPAVLTT